MRVKALEGKWLVVMLALGSLGAASGGGPLVEAAKEGDTAAVRALLQQGVDVNTAEVDGTTALHWAVYRDDLEAVDLLLRGGANVRATNRYGVAPLSLAARSGNTVNGAMVERLLAGGADPKTTLPSGETALMTAARGGNVAAVKALLAHGADVNAREKWKGQTALMWAAAENHAVVVQALIDAGADLHARSNVSRALSASEPGDKGFTALLFAVRAGQIDAARTLLAAGDDVNQTLSDDTSALVLATISAQLDMAAFLLDQGADPNAAAQGWTALHQMAYTRRPNKGLNTVGPVPRGEVDSLTLVRKLVAKGADVNARVTKEISTHVTGRNNLNRIGATPFFLAAHRVDIELMRLLVELGADTRVANEDGTTPLMVAAGIGLWFPGESPGSPDEVTEAVRLCLELGCGEVTGVDARGETALHGIAYWDSPGAAELLVTAGAKLDPVNDRGWTPLRIADGVAFVGSIHASPSTAALLRRMLKERGLPVPDPIIGEGDRPRERIQRGGQVPADSTGGERAGKPEPEPEPAPIVGNAGRAPAR